MRKKIVISVWVRKWITNMFSKMRARTKRSIFFFGYNQKMRKGEFFQLIKVRFKKQISEIRKQWKTNVWSLDFVRKTTKLCFFKCVLAPQEVTFFQRNKKMWKWQIFMLFWVVIEKQVFELWRKVKKKRLKSQLR